MLSTTVKIAWLWKNQTFLKQTTRLMYAFLSTGLCGFQFVKLCMLSCGMGNKNGSESGHTFNLYAKE